MNDCNIYIFNSLITIKICQLFRNFSNGANYARDLLIEPFNLIMN
jgi:hypothetical protein